MYMHLEHALFYVPHSMFSLTPLVDFQCEYYPTKHLKAKKELPLERNETFKLGLKHLGKTEY